MADKLEIDGLDELITKMEQLKSIFKDSVDSLSELTKAVIKASEEESKSAKTIGDVNKLREDQSKLEEDSLKTRKKISDSNKELTGTIEKWNKSIKDLKSEQLKLDLTTKDGIKRNNEIISSIKKVTQEKQKAANTTATWGKALDSLGFKFNTLGNLAAGFIRSGINAITSAFSNGLKTITDFEKGIAELSAITGATGDDLKFLEKAAIQLGSGTEIAGVKINKTAKEIVEAFKLAASAKPELLANVQALKGFTEQAIILAQASNGEVKDSISALTQIMNQFNAPTEAASKYINILAAGAKFGAGEVDYLQESITKSGVAAKTAGVSIETTAATMELFAEKGLIAEKAGTSYRNILLKLQSDTTLYTKGVFDYGKALDFLGKNQYNTTLLAEKFGAENVIAALALAQNRDRVDELTKSMTDTNAAYEQAEVNSKTLAFATKGLSSAWDSFVLSLSSSGGVLTSVVNAASFSLKALSLIIREASARARNDESELTKIEEERLNLAGKLSETQLYYIHEYRKYVNEKRSYDKALSEEEVLELKKAIYKIKGIRVEEIDDYKKYVDSKREYNKNLTVEELDRLKKVKKAQEDAAKIIENTLSPAQKKYYAEQKKLLKEAEENYKKSQQYIKDFDEQTKKDEIKAEEEYREFVKNIFKDEADDRINALNEEYATKILLAKGNKEQLKEIDDQYNSDLLDLEINTNELLLSLAENGSREQRDTINKLSDLKVKKAQESAKGQIEQAQLVKEKELEILKLRNEAFVKFGEGVGEVTASFLLGQKDAAKEALKSMIHAALESLKAYAYVQVGITTVGSLATPDSILTAGVSGAIRAGVMAGLITAAVKAAEIGADSLIDKFEGGTKDYPGGLGIVGDGNKFNNRELITLPDGTRFLTPNEDTLVNLPEHSIITPANMVENELRKSINISNMSKNDANFMVGNLLNDLNSSLNKFNNKKLLNINIDKDFYIHAITEQNRIKFIDKRYRNRV